MNLEHAEPEGRGGPLIAIGGAEDKLRDRQILRRFVAEAGGANARIVIIPTASQLDDTGDRYARIFHALSADETHVIQIQSREEALDPEAETLEAMEDASGIFISGGNQLRLSTLLGGTPLAAVLFRKHAAGAVVAGTSAGAALLAEHMIAFGQSGPSPSHKMVTLAPGLGLTHDVIIDQHFRQRDRLGRLLMALCYNPRLVGLGVDEDAAAIIDADRIVHVIGNGSVTVVDASQCRWTNADDVVTHGPIGVFGVKLDVLSPGCRYDLATRMAEPSRRMEGKPT